MRYRIALHDRVRHDLDLIRASIAGYRDASGLRAVPHKKAVIVVRIDDVRQVVRVLGVTYGGADWQRRVRARR